MALTNRQEDILEYLKRTKKAGIHELSQRLFVSDATIRRELIELKKLGLIERNHGGAVILESENEIAISVRTERDANDKKETAEIALPHLPNFKSVFIDNSSTALVLARMMNLRYKTVVTNGLVLASELSHREDVTVLMPGGSLFYHSNSLCGPVTLRSISEMHFGLMLASCSSISEDGAYESSLEQSEIKRMALKNSTNKVLLVGRTKFGGDAMYRTASLTEYNVIFTNAENEILEPFQRLKGVTLINK